MLKRTSLLVCTLICVFFLQSQSFGQTLTTFPEGSAIIDMGSASPTVQNSLKPYGLVYALLKNNHVPISVVVNANKVKDGIDFVYNGKSYKGGTFVVSADYISSTVASVLTSWANQGVLVDYTTSTSALTVNVTYKINFTPRWVMDKTNGSIAVNFLTTAGIPASAYTFKTPAQLAGCDDIFVLPHADPTWSTHNNLLTWNRDNKGAIWAGCHAVSVLENLFDPGTPTTKMNFLSTNGLLSFTDHNFTATPFNHLLPGDPVAQYYSKTDNAQTNGSETVYLPKSGSAWNSGAKIISTSPGQIDVPSLSPGLAVENIYGRAFDDPARGYVAYQAAHNIGGNSTDQIAAQRIFFNFSLFALNDKIPPIITASVSSADQITAGVASATFTSTVTGTGTGLTYLWSASVAGTFSAATSATTTFTPSSSITSTTTCIITCVVTESCGRVSFDSKKITVVPPPPDPINPLNVIPITKTILDGCATSAAVTFNVFDGNTDANAGTRTLLDVTALVNASIITSTNGNVTITANANFRGTLNTTYRITNGVYTSTAANITVTVGDQSLLPVLTDDAATALVDNVTVINVLGNDKNNAAAAANVHDVLYIKDIFTKPTLGYAYINTNGTLTYISKDNHPTGTDQFSYLACNTSGFCAVGNLSVTLINTGCAAGLYKNSTDSTTGFLTNYSTTLSDTYLQSNGGNADANFNTNNPNAILLNGFANALRRPLLKFDLSSDIPANARVTSANLSLTTTVAFTTSSGVNPFPATIYGVTQSWVESTATWNIFDTGSPWTTAGGDFTIAGSDPAFPNVYTDGVANPIGTVAASSDMSTLVQGWVTTPSSNKGMIIVGATSASTFNVTFGSQNLGSSQAKLNVFYKIPAACIAIPTDYLPIVYPVTSATSSVLSATITPSLDKNYYGRTNTIQSVTTPAHGTVTFSATQMIYAPAGNFVGVDTFTYTILDPTNTKTNTSTVFVTVTRAAPAVNPDATAVTSGLSATISVNTNDRDLNVAFAGAPTITSNPKNGVATVTGNDIVYTPSTGFVGNDTLIYRRTGGVTDACSVALSDTALVVITVNNRPPVGTPTVLSTFGCTPITINLLSLSSDPEGGALSVNITSGPGSGTLVSAGAGKYTYTPNNGFTGVDLFNYTVTDPFAATSTAVAVTITVTGDPNPNIAPVAVNDADTTLVNQVLYTNVLANDSDPNNDVLYISIPSATTTQGGTIEIMPNKLIKYTPALNFSGTDTYQYQLYDAHPSCSGGGSLTVTGTVTIVVRAIMTTLSGTVWLDADSSAKQAGVLTFNTIKTNTEVGTNGNGSIYVYVINSANKIIDKTPADIDGTYLLSNVPSGTFSLTLVLSNEDLSIGTTLTTGSLPPGYSNSTPMTRSLPVTTLADMGPYDWGVYTGVPLAPGIIVAGAGVCGTSGVPGALTSSSNATGGSITATGYVYQWQSATALDFSGTVTDIAGATGTSYSPTAISATTYYRRMVTNNVNTPVFSNVVTVVLTPNPTISISAAVITLLAGSNTVLTATGAGTGSYAWSPTTGLSASNTAVVTATPLTTTTYIVTGTITPSGCANTAAITLTMINPGVIAADQSICGPYTPAGITSTTVASGGTITYKWQQSPDNSTFTDISGETATTYSPGSISATTYYRRVAISGGLLFNSNVVTKTVKTIPTATAGSNSPICVNGTINLTSSGGGTYSWTGPGSFSSTSATPTISNAPATATGTYTVTVTVNGCTNTANTTVTLNPLPTATIGGTTSVCQNASSPLIAFTGAAGTAPYTFIYKINGGTNQTVTTTSGNSVTVSAPTGTAGAFAYTLVSVQDGSSTTCLNAQSGTATVTVNALPTATIGGTTAVCQNASSPLITFTGAAGTAPYTFIYKINGGTNQTVTTTSGNSVTVSAPTGTTGAFAYTLVSVQDASSTTCLNTQSGTATVTVNALATATIGGTTSVCQNASSPLITFTGAAGTAPYTFIYKINGGTNQTVTTTSGNSVTVSAPTGTTGAFAYTLVSVQDGSSTTCLNAQSGTATVTVNALPTATIGGTTAVCQNASSPLITFTGAAGTAPYTFIYKINGGTNQTVTTTSGNSVTVSAPTGTTGAFAYTLVSVQDGSSTTCLNAQSGTATVTVNALPTATIGGTTSVCKNASSPLITFTGAAGTAPYTFIYKINGGSNQTVTTTSGNSVTVSAPTGTTGAFAYTLVSVQDGSSTTCLNAQSGTATVTVNALPTATIGGTTAVCQNASSPLITFTGAAGTAPYTFIYKINGGTNQTVTTTSGNSVTVSAPTGTTGAFAYTLVSVQDGSSTTCLNAQSGTATVTVNALPTATIGGTTSVCQNASSPLITFTGAAGTAPYTFIYKINGGTNQTVTTTSGNSVTVSAPTGTAGAFAYTLVSVQDGSSTTCLNAQSGTATVTVNALPNVTVTPTSAVIQTGSTQVLAASGALTYSWSPTSNLSATNTATVTAGPLNATATYVVTGTAATGCVNTSTVTITVINPGTIGGNQTNCGPYTPNAFTSITDASGATPITYQWQSSSASDFSSDITTIAGAVLSTFAPTGITATTYYRRRATFGSTTFSSNIIATTVNTPPTVSIAPTSLTIGEGLTQTLTASGASTYSWTPATGLSATNTAVVIAGPITTTTYTVTGTTGAGCAGTSTILVTVVPSGTLVPGVIGSDQSNCGPFIPAGFTSTSDAAGVSSPITYQWQSSNTSDFSSGPVTISGATSSTYNPSSITATTYYRRVATSNSVSLNSNIVKATVNPIPVATATNTSPVCVGGTINLTATGGGTYIWSGPNSFSSTSATPAITAATLAAAGVYTVTATVGGCAATTTTTVTVNALPTVTVTPTAAVIQSGFTQVLAASGGALTYNWYPASNLSATNTATVTSGPLTTTTTYVVTGTNTVTGCVNTATATVTVINPGTIGTDQNNCGAFTPTAFTSTTDASGTSPITYQWQSSTTSDFSSSTTIAGATSSTYSPINISTTTYYRRVATFSGTSFNSNIVTATVKPIPVATAGNNSPVCAGGTVNLTSSGGVSYSWSGPNSFTSTSQNTSITSATISATGTYTVTVTGSNGCIATASTIVTVNALPAVSVSPTAVSIIRGNSTILSASGAVGYSWSPSTGLSATNTASVTASPLTTTTYTVTGTTTGCVNTATVTVTVSSDITPGPDDFTNNCINGAKGGTTSSVLDNDKINGVLINISQVNLSLVSNGGITGLAFDATGALVVPANTFEGTYTATYSICEKSNPANCAQTTATILVCRGLSITATAVCKNDVPYIQYTVVPNFIAGANPVTINWLNGDKTALTAQPVISSQALTGEILWPGAVTDGSGNGIDWPGWFISGGAWVQGADGFEKTRPDGYMVISVNPTDTIKISYPPATPACNAVPPTIIIPLTPGSIAVSQTICTGSTPAGFTSTTAAIGGTGTINYQWQRSTDNITYTNIPGATSATYGAGSLTQTTYYRRAASTVTNSTVIAGPISVTVLNPPVIGPISGPCAMPKDSTKTFSVPAVANATRYVWTLPNGWTGSSTTNSINATANNTGGTITVTAFNGNCQGNTVSYQAAVIDYTNVTISGTPITASGNNNSPITITISLYDVNGNRINCSGGVATVYTCDGNPGTFTTVVDNNDGTYTTQFTASANDIQICGTVGGIPVLKRTKVTFTGPQGGISSNGPILDFEIPKVTFTATAGRAPFTVIYHSAKSAAGKNDTLNNVTSGTAYAVKLIPSTTLYTLVSVIDANGERRDNNFNRDTTTTIVVAPKVIITLKADLPKKDGDSVWAMRLVVHTQNIGNMDLTNSQALLNLKTVFPAPVTWVLDSVKVSGRTVVPNFNYDGINNLDLFARLNKGRHNLYNNSTQVNEMGMADVAAPDGSTNIDRWNNASTGEEEDMDGLELVNDGHSIYMFGAKSALPVNEDASIILWLHVKPNGYTDPFVMQAVALGTGSTEGATALTTSLSNDNNDVNQHPEITKTGDPLPTVVNLFPSAVIGSSLSASTPALQGNGTYNVTLTYKVKNYGNLNLTAVQLSQDLLKSIGLPSTFNVVSPVTSTGNLIPNPGFNAKSDTNMLLALNSVLGYKKEATLSYVINITPNQLSSIYRLQATATGYSEDLSSTASDLSTDGDEPDPDGNNIPSERVITTIVINLSVPTLVAGNISTPAASCVSATGVTMSQTSTPTGGFDPYRYQWQSSVDNTTFYDIIGAESSSYTTGLVTKSTYYRRETISGSQVKYSNAVLLQINPAPTTPVITGTGTIVVGKGNITLTSPIAASYAWTTGAITRTIVVQDAGSYGLTITDANGCTAVATAYAITALDPYKVADVQKILSKAPALQADGSFLLSFNILASNLRTELLDSVRLKDDLSKVFPAFSTFTVTDIKASGALIPNTFYDGKAQIDLLNDVSKLAGSKTDSVQITIKVFPNGFAGTLNNVVTLTGRSPFGTVAIVSNDPVYNSNPAVRLPTKFVIPPVDIFIPTGYSPNRDGINDQFVIIRPYNTVINLEIYNRWSNLVYKSTDYKNDWAGKGNQANRVMGEDLPDGTYYYVVLATDKTTGSVRKFAGVVTLKR